MTKYVFGATLRRAKILDRITVNGPSAAPVRSYRFGYQVHAQSGHSRIDWAELCDAAGVCLPATEFEWSADAATDLGPDAWGTVDLAEEQAAFIGADHTIVGEFSGFDGEEIIFRDRDAESRWNMWLGPHADSPYDPGSGDEDYLLPIPALPYPDMLPPRQALSWPYDPDASMSAEYLFRLGMASPEFSIAAIDFNGDVLDDLLLPVRAGYPDEGWDDDVTPYAESLAIGANVDGEHFVTLYFEDGSEDRIYSVIPVDHDGDMLTDAWMCRGSSPIDGTWVLAQNHGAGDGGYGFDFHDTEIACTVHDEYTVASVDGGPSSLLVIPAYTTDGDMIPGADRDDYRRLRFEPENELAILEAVGLPRDRYQRAHDRYCRNGLAEDVGLGPTATAGLGVDRHIDVNDDGLPDVLRFELASGDDASNDDIYAGFVTDMDEVEARLAEAVHGASVEAEGVSLCGDADDLTHDAVVAVYYNTGAGYVRGPNALDLDGNAHAQLWLNYVGAVTFDLEDDGRPDLLMPATGPGTGWAQLEVDAGGVFQTHSLPGGDGWPAYHDDDTWLADMAAGARVGIVALGQGAARPSLIFTGAIEDSVAFPLWANSKSVHGDENDGAARVTSIVDGLGATTSFEYVAEAAPMLPQAPWPSAPLRSALWLTKKMAQSVTATRDEARIVDADATITRNYKYYDAAVDRHGRGFLGFGQVKVYESAGAGDPGGSVTTVTTYDQSYDPTVDDYPARGRPVEREVYTTVGPAGAAPTVDHIERELWTWQARALPIAGGMTHFAYADTHRSMTLETAAGACDPMGSCPYYDTSGTYRDETTTEVRDDFGTLTTSVRWSTDGSGPVTQVDQTEIVHDTARWLLGQVGRTSLTTCEGGTCAARVTKKAYDANTGAVVGVTLQPGDPALELTSTFHQEAHGNVDHVWQQGPDGAGHLEMRESITQWDVEGVFPLAGSNALGQFAYWVYDSKSGALVAAVDPAGLTKKSAYDGLYREVGSSMHSSPTGANDGAPITAAYLPADPTVSGCAAVVRTTTESGPRVDEYLSAQGDALERRWQGMGLLADPTTPNPIPAGTDVYERYGYDNRGRQVERSVPQWVGSNPDGWHQRSLDLLDRQTSTIAPDGTVLASVEYRASGVQNVAIVDTRSSQGAATLLRSTSLDGQGRPTQEVDADGIATCFTHGPFDALVSVERNCRGAVRRKSTTQYDALGHVVGQSDPDLGSRTSKWNAFGEIVQHTDGAVRVSTYVHDKLGRITSRTEPEGTATFTYDTERYGFISSDSSPDGVTRYFDADAFGRTWRVTSAVPTASGNDAYRLEWNYGPGGRVEKIRYPTPDNEPSVVARYVYDQAGYLRVVKDDATTAVRWSLKQANPSAMPRVETYGDGTTTTRAYDPQRLWTESIVHAKPGTPLAQLEYDWWPEGELHVRRDTAVAQAETFEYDHQWRLTRATVNADPARVVAYDVFGNITSMTGQGPYVYDPQARLISFGGLAVQYDGAGNVANFDGRTFVYNTFGKVRTIAKGGATLSMSYDAGGGRVRRRDSGTQIDVVTLGKLYERRLNSNGTTASSTWRIAAGDRVVSQIVRTRDGLGAYTTSEQYLHDDDLGSTVLVTASGGLGGVTTVARSSSDPWGRARDADKWNKWQTDAQAGAVGIGFTGHKAELDHGLIDADGRMYDPKSGRFMAPDPLVTQAYTGAAYNRFAYVGNRPLRFTDPTGWAASEDGDSEEEGEDFADVVIGFLEDFGQMKLDLDEATRTAAAFPSPIEIAETVLAKLIVEPAKTVGIGLWTNLKGLDASLKKIEDDPVGAAIEIGTGFAKDAVTVVDSAIETGKALGRGDVAEAASHHWNASQSAWSLAAIAASGAGLAKWVKGLAGVAAKGGGAQTYQIIDGVRRAKAAEISSQQGVGTGRISAQVLEGGKVTGTVEVEAASLLSPKSGISTAGAGLDRWLGALRQALGGSKPPPIQVQLGSAGTPIRDVLIE